MCFLLLVLSAPPASAQDWFDSFEDFGVGQGLLGEYPWDTWDANPAVDGVITDERAASGEKSLKIEYDNDIVCVLKNVTAGVWSIRVKYFIPDEHTGSVYFILMNQYPDNKAWAEQITMNSGNGTITTMDGGSDSIITGEWVELETIVDFNNNVIDIYYGGDPLVIGGQYANDDTDVAFAAIDLYAGSDCSPVYIDDLSVAQVPAPFRASQNGPDIVLEWGTPPEAEKTPLDISEVFNVDVIYSPLDAAVPADYFDQNTAVLIEDEFDGTGIANPGAQGLPVNGLVGQFELGPYNAPNALQFRSTSALDDVTIDLADGQYGSLLYCVSAGSGQVIVPVTVTYDDATTEEAEMLAFDWFADPSGGLSTAIDNMDRYNITNGAFEDSNNPALFSGNIPLAPDKTVTSITLRPSEADADWAGGATVTFNLFALTAVEHVFYELTREGLETGTISETLNDATTYRDAAVPEDSFTYTLVPTVGGIQLEEQSVSITWQDAILNTAGRVATWLILGHFPNSGGAAPGEAALITDYLAEPDTVPNPKTEADILPEEGMTMASLNMNCGDHPDCQIWFRHNVDTGYVDFNTIFGEIDNVMTYMAIYVVNNTAEPIPAQIGCGSDDSIAVLFDNMVVHANSVSRGHVFDNDRFPLVITPGEHRLMVKVFEGGGGHVGSLGLYDPETGDPLQPPDIELNPNPQEMTNVQDGGDGPDGFRAELTGASADEVSLNWTNNAVYEEIFLYRSTGAGLWTRLPVAADATSVTDTPGFGSFQYFITALTTDGGVCSYETVNASAGTDVSVNNDGYIQSWLVLGPLAQSGGAAPGPAMYSDYLVTVDGMNETNVVPEAGMAMEIDFTQAASTQILGPTSNGMNPDAALGIIPWAIYHDGYRVDHNAVYGQNYDNMMVYHACYITNTLEDPIELNGIVASDDSSVVMIDNQVIHTVGWVSWDETPGTFTFLLLPGEHRLMIKVFEGGGGNGLQFRLQDPETLEYITGDDERFTFSLAPSIESISQIITREIPSVAGLEEEVEITLQVTGGPVTVYEQIPLYMEMVNIGDGVEVEDGLIRWDNVEGNLVYTVAPIAFDDGTMFSGYATEGATWAYSSGTTNTTVVEQEEGWYTMDIADSGLAGFADIVPTDIGYDMSIEGSGSDVWGAADDFHYVFKCFPAESTVVIEGRLTEFVRTTNDWGKTGVMFRTNTAQGSPYVFGMISAAASGGQSGRCIQWRDAQSAGAAWNNVHPQQSIPVWIRAVYQNGMVSVFFAQDLGDGPDTWEFHARHDLNIGDAAWINGGIAVTSHDDAATITAVYSDIQAVELSVPAVKNLTAADDGDGNVAVQWEMTGEGTFDDLTVERFVLPVDLDWTQLDDISVDATSFLDITFGLLQGQYGLSATIDVPDLSAPVTLRFETDYMTSTPGEYLSTVLADQPLGYWRLDEASGSLTAYNWGVLGDAVNSSYRGTVLLEEPGLITGGDYAALFNGIDSGILVPNNAQINSSGPYHTISVELWFQAELVGAAPSVLFEQGGATRGLSIYVVLENNEPQLYLNAWNRAEEQWGPVYVSTPIEEGIPYHVVMVFEATMVNETFGDFDGRITGYLDGNMFDEATGTDQLYTHTGDVCIGDTINNDTLDKTATQLQLPFNGIIDEVAWYDHLLDDPNGDGDLGDSRVAAHYETGISSEGVSRFIGDANCDNGINIADAVAVLSYLFSGGEACCLTNMDANGDGGVNIADAVVVLSYLFAGGHIIAPGGGEIMETPGCMSFDPALISDDVMPCDTPCPYKK